MDSKQVSLFLLPYIGLSGCLPCHLPEPVVGTHKARNATVHWIHPQARLDKNCGY